MASGITVENGERALEDFLAGKPITPKISEITEIAPQIPKSWTLPYSVHAATVLHRIIMGCVFDHLSGCELGLMNVFSPDMPTKVNDVLLFEQKVSPGRIVYSDSAADEVYQRVEQINLETQSQLYIGGSTHFHPGGIPGPSGEDLANYEMLTKFNWKYQNFFGWVDVTDEFAKVGSENDIHTALDRKDAVLLTDAESQQRLFFKVKYGYSLFLIISPDADTPWAGLGEYKEYCFNGGPKRYRLLEAKDGLELAIVSDGTVRERNRDIIAMDIAKYVSRLEAPAPAREVLTAEIMNSSIVRAHPELVSDLEASIPPTAEEVMALLGDFLRFGTPTKEAEAVKVVHALLSRVYTGKGTYDDQFAEAQKILRGISPAYDAAMKLKNGGQDA